jgi:magnesium transporter
MAEPDTAVADAEVPAPVPDFRGPEGKVAPEFVAAVASALEAGDAARLKALIGDLHEADVGELISALPGEVRPRVVELLGADFDFTALTELDDNVRAEILEELPADVIAAGVRDLESDDAIYILEDLDDAERAEVLERLPPPERVALTRGLEFPEESAGRLMQTDLIAVPPFWTVGRTIDYLRETQTLPETFYELFVVDPAYKLMGTLPLDRLLRSKRPVKVEEIVHRELRKVLATQDREDVARLFARYNLVAAPVVDEFDRLVGVITVDDIVDVIREEGEEDVNRLVGVDAEAMAGLSPLQAGMRRVPWLLATMAIELCAGAVIAHFDTLLQEVILLASFMPVISAISGNVGLQAAAITVRGLDTGHISLAGSSAALRKEAATNFIMALICCVVLGGVGVVWSGHVSFGVVIGGALFAAMLTAGAMGTIIPMISKRLGFDPAATAGPFETAFQDVIGFAVFLWLASIFLRWLG